MLPVIVLAGGLATRLRPVTETLPKSLIPVNNYPFILHQLELFQKNGISNVHYCLGYLGNMVEEVVLKSRFPKSMDISFHYDGNKLLGTGGAIKKILHHVSDAFFVTYGDSYLDIDYAAVEEFYERNRTSITTGLMTVFRNEGKWDTSNVIFDNKKILLYSKKNKDSGMHYIDYGLGILTKNDFADYVEGHTFDLAEIYEAMSIKKNLIGFEVSQRFYEVGSFTGIDDISNYLKNKP